MSPPISPEAIFVKCSFLYITFSFFTNINCGIYMKYLVNDWYPLPSKLRKEGNLYVEDGKHSNRQTLAMIQAHSSRSDLESDTDSSTISLTAKVSWEHEHLAKVWCTI